jgi:hypothetical protein
MCQSANTVHVRGLSGCRNLHAGIYIANLVSMRLTVKLRAATLGTATFALFGLLLSLASGCEDKHDLEDGTCESPRIPIYTKAGCGKDVQPDCLGGAGACASNACSCDGKVIVTCNNYSSEKYQFVFDRTTDSETCKPVTTP